MFAEAAAEAAVLISRVALLVSRSLVSCWGACSTAPHGGRLSSCSRTLVAESLLFCRIEDPAPARGTEKGGSSPGGAALREG